MPQPQLKSDSHANEFQKKKKPKKTRSSDTSWCYTTRSPANSLTERQRYEDKNIESNIISQVFSFIWTEYKSIRLVRKHFHGDQKKVATYYDYCQTIKRVSKKCVNQEYMKNLFYFQPSHIGFRPVTRSKRNLEILSIEEFSEVVRRLSKFYLKNVCCLSIVTSRKMNRSTI